MRKVRGRILNGYRNGGTGAELDCRNEGRRVRRQGDSGQEEHIDGRTLFV